MAALFDIYLLSTGVGFVYIVGSALMGGIGGHGHGGAGHGGHAIGHGGGGHSLGHGSGGHAIGHGAGQTVGHGAGGHATGGHATGGQAVRGHATGGNAAGHSASTSGHPTGGHSIAKGAAAQDMGHSASHSASSGNGAQSSHSSSGRSTGHSSGESAQSAQEIAPVMTQSGPIRKRSRDSSDLFLQILDILNPTKLALFIFLFGAIGVLSVKSIGLISLAPAIIMGWVLANVFFNLMGSILMRMHSSTNFSKQSLVGAIGELTISIPPSSTGEVVIATGSSRYSAAAKCSDPEQTIKKLTKVIVVDIKDGMFFVEPFEDTDL